MDSRFHRSVRVSAARPQARAAPPFGLIWVRRILASTYGKPVAGHGRARRVATGLAFGGALAVAMLLQMGAPQAGESKVSEPKTAESNTAELKAGASEAAAQKAAGPKATTQKTAESKAAGLQSPESKAREATAPDSKTAAPKTATSKSAVSGAASAEETPVVARDVRLAGDERRTRLIVDLDRAVAFRAFTLGNPYRVILDLSDVTFKLDPDQGQLRRGLVSAYRFGLFAPGKARMVLELTGPVAVDKAFVLDPVDDQPARLVVDLVRTDPESFAKATATAAEQRMALGPQPAPVPASDDKRPVIVLDPGHGGIDSGTTGYSAYAEKNIVLDAALMLREKLEKAGAYRVVMTRTTDVFVPLAERVRIARANGAALFISLHADALARGDGKARGASVYTLSETASDAEAAHLAEKENKADLIAGVDLSDETDEVADILVDLAQRETRNFSALFAHTLVGAMKSTVYTHRSPLKSAGFRVLKAHDVPSVLVELGYMSSPADLKLLTSDAWRDRVTDAIMHAIGEFFAQRVAGSGPDGAPEGTLPAARPPER